MMKHRHLNHNEFTLAAIDSFIARGHVHDWIELKAAADTNPVLLDDILCIALSCQLSPYDALRYRYWEDWAYRRLKHMDNNSLWFRYYQELKHMSSSYEQKLFIERKKAERVAERKECSRAI